MASKSLRISNRRRLARHFRRSAKINDSPERFAQWSKQTVEAQSMHEKSDEPKPTPHTTPADFHEGPDAASRFAAAVKHLATIPAAAVPGPQPHPRSKPRRKPK